MYHITRQYGCHEEVAVPPRRIIHALSDESAVRFRKACGIVGLPMKKFHLTVLTGVVCAIAVALSAQSTAITVVLTGQSMIRSDLRATKPAAIPVIKGLLNGDVIFTNLEGAVALPGETIEEGRAFLTPPEALDALTAMGFNLLALSGNHAFDLKEQGIRNTIRELDRRRIVHAGTGNNAADAAAPAYLKT